MVRRRIPLFLISLSLLFGCAKAPQKYTRTFDGVFDTVVTVIAYADNAAVFDAFYAGVESRLQAFHRLFDIYHTSPEGNNAKTINDNAGIRPVRVAPELLTLIETGLSWYGQTQGAVNIAMGPVLRLWDEARQHSRQYPETAYIPSAAALQEAAALSNPADVIVDRAAGTVFLTRQGMALDLGAIAKGYAVQWTADDMAASPVQSFLISAGGNVLARGVPVEKDRNRWGVGLQDPDEDPPVGLVPPLEVLYVHDLSVVTSGDYQRFFRVNGTRYSHIVDPRTGMPPQSFRSVSIIASDSGVADACSTAFFVLSLAEGRRLAAALDVDAVWALPDGQIEATPGAQALMKSKGAPALSKTAP